MRAELTRMTILDVDAVAALEEASFARPWKKADFEYEMTQNPVARYLVARKDGKIIGFSSAHIYLDEVHIANVVVDEAQRGQGIGRALMDGLMQYAANLGVSYMTLEVRVSNAAAIALYQSLGFFKVSVRPKYYEDNQEDALLMVCDKMPEADPDFAEDESLIDSM